MKLMSVNRSIIYKIVEPVTWKLKILKQLYIDIDITLFAFPHLLEFKNYKKEKRKKKLH
jgi:hypothetical protein